MRFFDEFIIFYKNASVIKNFPSSFVVERASINNVVSVYVAWQPQNQIWCALVRGGDWKNEQQLCNWKLVLIIFSARSAATPSQLHGNDKEIPGSDRHALALSWI